MNKIIRLLPLTLLLVLLSVSCSKSNDDPGPDITVPTIEFTKPNADGTTSYTRGLPMDLNATFKDDRALSKCIVTITYTEESPKTVLKGIGSPWAPAELGDQFTIDFTGEKEKVVSVDLFDDPIEAACLGGKYTLKFVVTDKTGNELTKLVDVTLQ